MLLVDANIVYPDSNCVNCTIAVNEGKITSVFKSNPDSLYVGKQRINLKNQYIYAGFIDAHTHFIAYGLGLAEVDLTGTKSWEEVVERTVQFYHENPKAAFIKGRGWDQNDWDSKDFPNNDTLNHLFPNLQVVLTRIDGHAVIANNFALREADITLETLISGGSIVQENGILSGILIDNATSLIQLPKPTSEQLSKALLLAQKNCFEVGLTSVVEAGLSRKEIDMIDSLQKEDQLHMSIYAMIADSRENLDYYTQKGPYKSDYLNVRSFKFYGDGALGSRGACLLKPYSDKPSEHGFLLHEIEYFSDAAKLLAESGFQMCTHAIGDSANRVILDIYGKYCSPENDLRWRIEHAQVVAPSDFPLFGKYGVIPSVQPTHATSDMYWAENRLGDRIRFAYAYHDLLNSAGLLASGTDFPVEEIYPLNTFYAAVVRKDTSGFPELGFQIENQLSRADALKSMTEWAAFANFEEEEKGRIDVGKWADFTILDTDLMHCSEDDILKAKITRTIVHGSTVYTRQ